MRGCLKPCPGGGLPEGAWRSPNRITVCYQHSILVIYCEPALLLRYMKQVCRCTVPCSSCNCGPCLYTIWPPSLLDQSVYLRRRHLGLLGDMFPPPLCDGGCSFEFGGGGMAFGGCAAGPGVRPGTAGGWLARCVSLRCCLGHSLSIWVWAPGVARRRPAGNRCHRCWCHHCPLHRSALSGSWCNRSQTAAVCHWILRA